MRICSDRFGYLQIAVILFRCSGKTLLHPGGHSAEWTPAAIAALSAGRWRTARYKVIRRSCYLHLCISGYFCTPVAIEMDSGITDFSKVGTAVVTCFSVHDLAGHALTIGLAMLMVAAICHISVGGLSIATFR